MTGGTVPESASAVPPGRPGGARQWSAPAIAGAVPFALVFVASACIMVIELVAGRLIARHVGSSLYTWTSIIAVVLAGISVGNYVGGVLAERAVRTDSQARTTLAAQFFLAAFTSLSVLWVHAWVFEHPFVSGLSWPLRIATGVGLTFFVPSVLLGTVAPVVATWALVRADRLGRTVGGLYAWGSIGAIAGTLLTGFWLVASFGTSAVVAGVALVLGSLGLLLDRSRRALVGLALVVAGIWLAAGPWVPPVVAGLQPPHAAAARDVVLWTESSYQTISVQVADDGLLILVLDDLTHGYLDPVDPSRLEYEYLQVYDVVTEAHVRTVGSGTPSALMLGGGAFTYPKYFARAYPGSRVVVVEIDERVTEAMQSVTDPAGWSGLEVIHLDGRQAVKDLVAARDSFTYVYTDAFRDVTVPYHLTTTEFMAEVHALLTDDGLVIANIIDTYRFGRFLGAYVRTVASVFRFVYVFSSVPPADDRHRDTFVVVGAKRPLNAAAVEEFGRRRLVPVHAFDRGDMATLARRGGGILLTDEFTPVENLLAAWQGSD